VRDATQQHLRGLMKSELEWVRKMPRARGTKSKSRLDKFDRDQSRCHARLQPRRGEASM
jgi:hypothetical protein